MQIKICGIRTIEAAEAAVKYEANYIGFIFVKGSKREISPQKCLEITNRIKNEFPKTKVKFVGLFGDQDLSEIDEILDKTDLDMVQLCGEKDFDISISSIRQIRIKESDSSSQVLDYVQKALLVHNYVVLDSYHEKKLGGTGNKFDWNKAKNVIGLTNVLVSGGLDTENIESLIKNFSPYGIDTSSGVETNGVKDLEKIKKFIKLAKN